MSKLRVGVLMGGKSIEKEVSFNSGRTICDHLDTSLYEIVPLFQTSLGILYQLPWRFLYRGKISDFEHRLDAEAKQISWDDLKQTIDFMYIAAHGRFAEDGSLQGFLEVLGIPYLGSKVHASALGMNKIMQQKILSAAGINTPKSCLFTKYDTVHNLNEAYITSLIKNADFELPCIIKPTQEGSSLGISVVKNADELVTAIKKSAYINGTIQDIIIEEYINGMEFTCIIITDHLTGKLIPLPPTEIIKEVDSDFFDYEQKYMPGRATKFTPARCAQEIIQKIQDVCCATMQTLGIENIGRIDGFVKSDGSIVIIDPNTLAGMSPSSFLFRQAAEINMSHTQFINHLIETELYRYGMEKSINTMNADIQSKNKTKVAVLFGGKSNEREISLESGRNVFYKLSPENYEPLALFVDSNLKLYAIPQSLLVCNSTKEIALALDESMLIPWSKLPTLVDFVFIALHGGEGENGSIQGTLEMLGLPYNGSSVLASSLCINKYRTNHFLKSQGFNVPASYLAEKESWYSRQKASIDAIESILSYPMIVKPHDDGCSMMVKKANNKAELIDACEAIFSNNKSYALVEECIIGCELTVGVLGNYNAQALPPSKAVTSADILSIEEKFLPGAGENQTPAPLPNKALEMVKRIIEQAYQIIGCKGYARIDCFYQNEQESPSGKERVIFIEVNTLPGLTPATCIFHQAAEINIKPMDFIDAIIKLGFEEHTTKRTSEQQTNIKQYKM